MASVDLVDELARRRLLIVTGKGGVGKSTVAGALGLALAGRGRRVLVVEVASQERMSRVFSVSGVGYAPRALAPNLSALSIDPQTAMEEYLTLQLPSRRLASLVSNSKVFNSLASAAPGLREVVTLGKIWYLVHERTDHAPLLRDEAAARGEGEHTWDTVIVDAPATGHGLAFLHVARTFADVAKVGPIATQSRQMNAMLTDRDGTGVVLVALPEEMPVNEAAEMHERLTTRMDMAVAAVVVNGMYPRRFGDAELDRLAAVAPPPEPGAATTPARAALVMDRRARQHAEQAARLDGLVDGDALRLPFLFRTDLDLSALRDLAERVADREARAAA